eukprot:5375833-Pleurochrysis_carterae.AAC.2
MICIDIWIVTHGSTKYTCPTLYSGQSRAMWPSEGKCNENMKTGIANNNLAKLTVDPRLQGRSMAKLYRYLLFAAIAPA